MRMEWTDSNIATNNEKKLMLVMNQ